MLSEEAQAGVMMVEDVMNTKVREVHQFLESRFVFMREREREREKRHHKPIRYIVSL